MTASFQACLKAIERIAQVVEDETAALNGNQAVDLGEFNRRKSQGLLELTRGLRGLEDAAARQAIERSLRPLRAKLEENSAVLRRHLSAVQEVTSIVARAIRDGESDGTYSAAIRFPARGR
jgi:hypothetical protein